MGLCSSPAGTIQEAGAQCVCVGCSGQPGKSLPIIYIGQGRFTMAAQAKVFRQVKKEELEACIEDAMDAIGNVRNKKLKTNNVRTLMTRKNALVNCYEAWNKACRDYSILSYQM